MQAMDDLTLLREYAARDSEAAFAELVTRRVGFVYAAALRQVRDPHLAEEITQAVFIILAQNAGRISGKTILAGWLFKTTRFAANAKTAEQVPSLIYVADGYTKDELKKFIMTGERDIPRMNLAGPESPHFMPSWGIISSSSYELDDLPAFLFSLKPKGEKSDF